MDRQPDQSHRIAPLIATQRNFSAAMLHLDSFWRRNFEQLAKWERDNLIRAELRCRKLD